MKAAERIEPFTEDGVTWTGQTIASERDDDEGCILFGNDGKGNIYIRIVCDKRDNGGAVETCQASGEAEPWLRFLSEWFAPPHP